MPYGGMLPLKHFQGPKRLQGPNGKRKGHDERMSMWEDHSQGVASLC